ncbi:unnamed protein product [Allacma fusca]|uniref:F-box domain-containing protein n=1 Tax=Allacma fusca TaxID=39272 RepID=A0A8J2L3H2_9HEXA|nr:unnamed protein product [Allacma fusca]
MSGRKRLRTLSGFDETKWPSEMSDTSDELQEFINTIPSMVSYIFLSNLRNVRLLKVCRQVCYSWNVTASESLGACSMVRINEGDSKLSAFTALLLRRSFGPLQRLPMPFKNFNVTGMSFTDPIFLNLVHLPHIAIKSLRLKNDNAMPNLDQAQLGRVLASKSPGITDLIICRLDNLPINNPLLTSDGIKLTALKRLIFSDSCLHPTHTQFVANILSLCKPEEMELTVRDGVHLIKLLSQDKLQNLKVLDIILTGNYSNAWEHLVALRFLRLKSFGFYTQVVVSNLGDLQNWGLLCQSVSQSVTEFSTNLPVSTNSVLRFPNVEILKVQNNSSMSALTPDRFPALSRVTYTVTNPLGLILENDILPHPGVHSVTLSISTEEPAQNELFDEKFQNLLTYLKRQFPNVSSLEFSIKKFHPVTIADICEAFPRLTTITLDGECSFFCFSSMRDHMVTSYLELGWPVEKIPRRKSITDFMELECLTFGPAFFVTPEIVIHCLPRLPKLRRIEFQWNPSLSRPLLRDSIGHLQRIVISNAVENISHPWLVQVFSMLPNAYHIPN